MEALIKCLNYCTIHNFEKTSSFIEFPMASNKIEELVGKYDADFVLPIKDDFSALLSIFLAAKELQINSLY